MCLLLGIACIPGIWPAQGTVSPHHLSPALTEQLLIPAVKSPVPLLVLCLLCHVYLAC